jgi:hypothetical protein
MVVRVAHLPTLQLYVLAAALLGKEDAELAPGLFII